MSTSESFTRPGAVATLLELDFGGYFMTRLATDPDPTNERRGLSGYTMALASEPELDQVIRLHVPQDSPVMREPARELGIAVGVQVRDVRFDGAPFPQGESLLGARLALEGANPPFPGPIFESRNNIVGSDDTMMFIINPFELAVYPRGDDPLPAPDDPQAPGRERALLRARDYLDPCNPQVPVWEIEDPSTYVRRLPSSFVEVSSDVLKALGIFNPERYFDRRLAWLYAQLDRQVDPRGLAAEELKSRIFQIELWGKRVWNKLAFQLNYDFRINGEQQVHEALRGLGYFDTTHPWHFTCWFGGWDGDLLVGYCKGTLGIPFRPHG